MGGLLFRTVPLLLLGVKVVVVEEDKVEVVVEEDEVEGEAKVEEGEEKESSDSFLSRLKFSVSGTSSDSSPSSYAFGSRY